MCLLTQTNSYYGECHVENEIEKQHKKCIKEDHLTLKKVECINQGWMCIACCWSSIPKLDLFNLTPYY